MKYNRCFNSSKHLGKIRKTYKIKSNFKKVFDQSKSSALQIIKLVSKYNVLFITCTKTNDINTEPVPSGVLLKRCSANPQQIYSRAPVQKCYATFLKLHFRMGLLLHICYIFAGHIFEGKLWGTASENNSFV